MKLNSAEIKIAFTGSVSSGKTAAALETAAQLKQRHFRVSLVESVDRRHPWDNGYFPQNPQAHVGMITRQIAAEVEATLRADTDIVVCDRTVMDMYAVAMVDHPDSILIQSLEPLVNQWATTYVAAYYLEPFPLHADGFRPDLDFVMRCREEVLGYLRTFVNVRSVNRLYFAQEIAEVISSMQVKAQQ